MASDRELDPVEETFKERNNGVVDFQIRKIRGAMLKFVRETDEIRSGAKSPTYVGFIKAFDAYMTEHFGDAWGKHRDGRLNTEYMIRRWEEMMGDSDEFAELVEEKWERRDDPTEGI